MLTTSIFCTPTGSIAPELLDFDNLNLRQAFEGTLKAICSEEVRESPGRPCKRTHGISLDVEQPSVSLEDFHIDIRRLLGTTADGPASILYTIK